MPKAPSSPSSSAHQRSELGFSSSSHAGVLKRNQACHQCRKRKLKCDAKRPCSTCVRSHHHAVTHARPDAMPPPYPECTFDEIPEPDVTANEVSKSKYEKLENRISELETLLRQKDQDSASRSTGSPSVVLEENSVFDANARFTDTNPNIPALLGNFPENDATINPILDEIFEMPFTPRLGDFTSVVDRITGGVPSPLSTGHITSISPDLNSQLIWSSPPNLPPPSLLKHLVEAFFAFHPYSHRLLHRPTFLSNMLLPSNDPRFPCVAILHAICAMSSSYTTAVSSPPLPSVKSNTTEDLFPLKEQFRQQRVNSFAEQQAMHAKQAVESLSHFGDALVECLQALVILNWYYWNHARWVEAFMGCGHALRSSMPMGLNTCSPFHTIQASVRISSILPPAKTALEEEIRRNTFYLSYVAERQQGIVNGWATTLDDADITQMLPVRGEHFEQGLFVPERNRQWFHQRDILLSHLESQTDSFTLMIKSCMLLSKVKNFNNRYRSLISTGDLSYVPSNSVGGYPQSGDPRDSPAFAELDNTLSIFRSSFPYHLKHAITDNIIDVPLYSACLAPFLGIIILHEPHARIKSSSCVSTSKVLSAARQILDLIYAVFSTSFDVALLDLFCCYCWYTSGRIFSRLLQAAQEANDMDQVNIFKSELESVQFYLGRMACRVPLAYRYHLMLANAVC